MLFSLQLYKFLHLLGLAMYFGGCLTALLITKRCKDVGNTDQAVFVASHLVAAPGLITLMFTGFAQSYLHQWVEFQGEGFMHAKITLVALSTFLLGFDIRLQGKMRRARLPESGANEAQVESWLHLRASVESLNVVCILLIYGLIVFRPF
jgi:uncharacterized membrane protein